jgi:LysM repeat protein
LTTPEKVIATATHFVDIKYKEGKSNDSIFGKWYGLNHNPWCAMFVSYCFGQNGAANLVAASSKKGFASCSAAVAWFKKKGQMVPATKAQAGDVVFLNFDSNPDADHVGIVVKNDTKKRVLHTIEGNTLNPAGGSQGDGDGVYRKVRPYSLVVGIGRPKWPGRVTTPATPPKAVSKPVSKPVSAPAPVKKPVKTVKVVKGDSYWRIAEQNLPAGKTVGNYTKELQVLNGDKPLHPGDIVRLK